MHVYTNARGYTYAYPLNLYAWLLVLCSSLAMRDYLVATGIAHCVNHTHLHSLGLWDRLYHFKVPPRCLNKHTTVITRNVAVGELYGNVVGR